MTAPSTLVAAPGGRRPDSGDSDPDRAEFAFRVRRLRDTALRLKWLVAAIVVAGGVAGLALSRFVAPEYEVRGTVYIAPDGRARGPIGQGEVIADNSWVDLLKSFRVLDSVVTRQGLHVRPSALADSALFRDFRTSDDPRVGRFTLRISDDGRSYTLFVGKDSILEQGALPDSVGRSMGFDWFVPAQKTGGRDAQFSIVRPRDVSLSLRGRIATVLPERGQLLTVILRGNSGRDAARTLDAILSEFVAVAAELRRGQSRELGEALQQQLDIASARLRLAESALEQFRVANITRPGEAGGGGASNDPVVREYFDRQLRYEEVRRESEALERALAGAVPSIDAIRAVPSATASGDPLRLALDELASMESKLAAERRIYSDEYSSVRALLAAVESQRRDVIPRLARQKLASLRTLESELRSSLDESAREVRQIPQRTLTEARLRREFAVADQFYTSLLTKVDEVRLAAASTVPEVSVLDRPQVPTFPSSNTAPRIAFLGIVAGIGMAVFVAFLLDQTDRRVRYPEEIQRGLGLEILGYVPRMPRETRKDRDALAAAQAVEAFRTIRLRIQHDCAGDAAPLVVITSAGAGDGKSLISANVATSFADSGIRTLLIDGDMRRGAQHATFGVAQHPGLTDLLANVVPLDSTIVPTSTPGLDLLPCGRRHRRVPELLSRDRLDEIFREVRGRYGAVIIDTAPLAAGVDAYALAVAAGNAVLVLRQAVTDRRQAEARLQAADRLPIRLLGAILNDVPAGGALGSTYSYYSYLPEYALLEGEAPQAVLPAPKG